MILKEWLVEKYTKEQLLKLTILNCSFSNITSLEGIEVLKNLEALYCRHNDLKNLDGVEFLPKLRSIDCSFNLIKDICDLKAILNMNNLEYIDIYNNRYNGMNTHIDDINKLKKDINIKLRKNKIKKLLQ